MRDGGPGATLFMVSDANVLVAGRGSRCSAANDGEVLAHSNGIWETMISTQGTVTAVDGRYAIVETAAGGCGRCDEVGGCGGHNLGKMLCRTPSTFRVLNPVGAEVGDRVAISVADGALRQGATLAYALPGFLLIAGAAAGAALAGPDGKDLSAIAGAVVGLVAGWGILAARRGGIRHEIFEPYIESRARRD